MLVRPARHEETQPLAAIGMAAWQRGLAPLLAPDVAERLRADNPFLPFLAAMGDRILVAEHHGQLLGFGGCEHGDGDISDIWVAPEHEGKGAGKALLSAFERRARMLGLGRITIGVAAGNGRALRLYRHLGYVETERGETWDAALGCALEMVRLAKRL